MDWSEIPVGLLGNAGGIGVLTLIIVYLLRVNGADRKDSAERLITIQREDDARLAQERTDHTAERAWVQTFYEHRLQKITENHQQEITDLRAEVAQLRARLGETEQQLRRRQEDAS